MAADLALRNGLDPAEEQVEADHKNTNNPEGLSVVGASIHEPKDNRENNTTQITAGTRGPRNNTVGMRVHVRDKREVSAVAGLEENRHERDEPDHSRQVVGVDAADNYQENTGQAAADIDPHFLGPEVAARGPIQDVGGDAAEGPGDDVEEAEHGGPVGGVGLADRGEVLDVVGAEDRVDGQLAAERAHVRRDVEERLRGY